MVQECIMWLSRRVRRTSRPVDRPDRVVECPICQAPFEAKTSSIQIDYHVDSCIALEENPCFNGIKRSENEIINACWMKCFGQEVNGRITFTDNDSLSYSDDDGVSVENEISDSLLRLIHNSMNNNGMDEVKICVERFMRYESLPMSTFSPIRALTIEQKRQWFYAQLNSFKVNFASSWVDIMITRESILYSSFSVFRALSSNDFHKEFKVRFVGEPSMDAGGITREWLSLCSAAIFNPNLALFSFSEVDNLTYQINPHSAINERHLEYFYFVGKLIGKAIFDKQVIYAPLVRPILKMILQTPVGMEDLAFVDFELYNSLFWMLSNEISDIIFETFSIEEDKFGETIVHLLKENGQNIPVKDSNKEEYVKLRVEHKVTRSIEQQVQALSSGIWDVIPISLLSVFDFQELDLIINGLPQIDPDDWERHTNYEGDFDATHPVVKWFWSLARRMSHEERSGLLHFTTGSSRVPPDGFAALESNRGQQSLFTLRSLPWAESAPFPKAHTCFNRLDLPTYQNPDQLEKYLLLAIRMEGTGFSMEE